MTIPDYQTLMRPVLVSVKDTAKNTNEVVLDLINHFKISDEEVRQKQPSGRDTVLRNRTQWSFKYLFEAKLLDRPERGKYKVTERGLKVLKQNNERVDNTILEKFEEFNKWKYTDVEEVEETQKKSKNGELQTPEEKLRSVHTDLKNLTKKDLLSKILDCSSEFFERLVIELIVAMGYGSSVEEASQLTRRTGDGGIDGLINQDKLGLDKIYIQAKRWKDGKVTESTVRNFVGAMDRHAYASKGVIITTSRFTSEAKKYREEAKTQITKFNYLLNMPTNCMWSPFKPKVKCFILPLNSFNLLCGCTKYLIETL